MLTYAIFTGLLAVRSGALGYTRVNAINGANVKINNYVFCHVINHQKSLKNECISPTSNPYSYSLNDKVHLSLKPVKLYVNNQLQDNE